MMWCFITDIPRRSWNVIKVTSKLYPPAIHYTVLYNSPPDFEKAISRVLEVKITGTDKPQNLFPIKVYKTSGECMHICHSVYYLAVHFPFYSLYTNHYLCSVTVEWSYMYIECHNGVDLTPPLYQLRIECHLLMSLLLTLTVVHLCLHTTTTDN